MISFNQLGRYGRLGNQMFQYAALLGIGRRMGYDVCIPASDAVDLGREHQLFQAFDLTGPTKIGDNPGAVRLKAPFHFAPQVAYECPDDTDLDGFFQSELYFQDQAPLIRREFAFRAEVTGPCRQAIAAIGPQVIGLHVRRTDYLAHPEVHPPLGTEYYQRALDQAPPGLPVLVFSDDLDWCRAQPLFQGGRFTFSEGRGNIADLCLMSLCRHQIIANSSFSWWGAWLNPAKDKVVIAPQRWFGTAGHTAAYDTRDLIPERWARI